MMTKNTPKLEDLEIPKSTDVPNDVITLYRSDTKERPSKARIAYDIFMLVLLVIDLLFIFIDKVLMNGLTIKLAEKLGFSAALSIYQSEYHLSVAALGGMFTLFWVAELSVRWLRAIVKRTYYRWFFFPFVHWYEVLGCFPALRALRLLRAGVIIKRLHAIDIKVIPERWLRSAQFYYHVILEELSDRVILTAIDNFKEQMANSSTHGQLIQDTINKNRAELEVVLLDLLRRELSPKLSQAFLMQAGDRMSTDIGRAVERALISTPELRKYLKLIPIAGTLIEGQITTIGKSIGENVTTAVNQHLFDPKTLDALMVHIAKGVANIDTTHPELQRLVSVVVNDGLSAFESQIKMQQWKHKEQLALM